MTAMLYISLCLTGIGLASALLMLAFGDYPRIVRKTRGQDVLYVAISVVWIIAIVLVLWGAK